MAKPPAVAYVRSRSSRAAAVEEVRREVARELHDRVAQTLTTMLVELENFKSEQVAWDDVLRQLTTIQDSTRDVLMNLRQLLIDLRTEDRRTSSLVDSIAALIARFELQTGIAAELSVDAEWPDSFSEPVAMNVYRIIEEALANVRKHSGARSVRVALGAAADGRLSVTVADDGRGFVSESDWPGMGTLGMRERAVILAGQLDIVGKVGGGTTVVAAFPRPVADAARLVEKEAPGELLRAGAVYQQAEVGA